MAIMAKKVAGLIFKGRSFYSRISIPTPLRHVYGKTEISTPLGRVSHPQAEVKHRELEAQHAARFQTQLHELGVGPTAPIAPAAPLTLALIPALAKALESHILTADEEIRAEGLTEDEFTRREAETREAVEEVSRAYARGDSAPIAAALDDWLNSLGIDAPRDSPEFKLLRREFLKARLKAIRGTEARNRGEVVETPEAPPVASLVAPVAAPKDPCKKPVDSLKMRDIFELWRDHEAKRPLKTVSRTELAVSRFEKHTGNPAIGSLTRTDGANYRKQLMADKELTPGMARAQLVQMNVLLNFEVDNYQRITANQFHQGTHYA
jgi:hypothetical protein